MNKIFFFILKRYPNLDINQWLFSSLFVIPTILIGKIVIDGPDNFSLFVSLGYVLCFFTNRILWNLRNKLYIIKTHLIVESVINKKPETSNGKPNLYIVK